MTLIQLLYTSWPDKSYTLSKAKVYCIIPFIFQNKFITKETIALVESILE